MTKEERLLRQEQRERAKAIEAAAREAGRGPLDLPYLLLVLTLVGVGLIMLFSASFPSAYYEEGNPAYYLIRQGIFAILGITAMFIVGKINYERYRAVAKMLLIFSIILLVLVLIPGIGTGRLTHGAQRWIRLGPIQFQPSEITKVGIILYFADSISKKKDKMATLRYGIVPYVAILGVIAALMAKEPHLSGMVLLLGIGAVMMYVGGIRNYWVGIGIALVLTGCMLYVSDKMKRGTKTETNMTISDALIIGLCQCVATIPGLSRSGTTITAGIATGLDRKFAVKFSFLLSIPAVLGANIISLVDAFKEGVDIANVPAYLIGMVVAMVAGIASISLLRRIAEKGRFGGLAYYCWVMGVLSMILTMIF